MPAATEFGQEDALFEPETFGEDDQLSTPPEFHLDLPPEPTLDVRGLDKAELARLKAEQPAGEGVLPNVRGLVRGGVSAYQRALSGIVRGVGEVGRTLGGPMPLDEDAVLGRAASVPPLPPNLLAPAADWMRKSSENAAPSEKDSATIGAGVGEAAGGFLPVVMSGPAAPAVMGLQAAGETTDELFNQYKDQGMSEDEAARKALARGLASGVSQAALWAVLPGPLRKAGDRLLAQAGGDMAKAFLVQQGVHAAEGAVLGGASRATENITSGKPALEGVPEAALGMAGMQAVLPRGGIAPAPPPERIVPRPFTTPEAQSALAARSRSILPEAEAALREVPPVEQPTTPEVPNASSLETPATVHVPVREQPVEGAREVPPKEGGQGVQPPEVQQQGQVPLTEKYPGVFDDVSPGNTPIEIKTADGKIVPALFKGYQEVVPPGQPVPAGMERFHGKAFVAYQGPTGWSHGIIHPGDEIVSQVPDFEKWKANKAKPPEPAAPPAAEPKPTARVKKVESSLAMPDSPLTHVEGEIGKIRLKGAASPENQQHYGESYNKLRKARPDLFSPNGTEIDIVESSLAGAGKNVTRDNLFDTLLGNHRERADIRAGNTPEGRQEKFMADVDATEHGGKTGKETVPVGQLRPGETFTVNGKLVTVGDARDGMAIRDFKSEQHGGVEHPNSGDIAIDEGSLDDSKVKAYEPSEMRESPPTKSETDQEWLDRKARTYYNKPFSELGQGQRENLQRAAQSRSQNLVEYFKQHPNEPTAPKPATVPRRQQPQPAAGREPVAGGKPPPAPAPRPAARGELPPAASTTDFTPERLAGMSDAEVAGQLAAVRHEQIQPHAQTRPLLDRLADDREALQNEQAKRRKARTDEIEKRRENARYRELEQALDRDPDGPDSAKNRRELIALGNQIDRGGTGQTGARPPETPAPAPPSSSYPPPVGEQQQLLEEPVPYDAKPPEAGGEEPPATNITNARSDAERAKRGLPPMETTLRRGWGKAVDIAREKLAANPQVTDELIAELNANPRAIEDWEDVLLAQRFMDLQSQHSAAAGDIVKARETGDDSSVTAARSRKAVLDDQLQALDTAMKQGGTRTAQGLAARKAMLREDWSLAAMELRARADMPDGLTEDEINARIDEIGRQHAELEKIKAEQDRNEAAALESEVKSVFDEILNGTPKEPAPFSQSILDAAEKIVKTLENKGSAAAKRIRARTTWSLAGVPDPTLLVDLGIVGSAKIARIGLDVAKWGVEHLDKWKEAMVSEFGDRIKPHFDKVFEQSKKQHEEDLAKAGESKPAVKRRLKKTADVNERKAATVTALTDRINAGQRGGITPLVRQLVRQFVENGIRDPNELIDAVHGVLHGIDPTFTRDQAMRAIPGYGEFRLPKQDEISKTAADLTSQVLSLNQLAAIISKKPVEATGFLRGKMSDAKRRLVKAVNEAKRRFGVVITDPATQLRGALEARKTYVRNRIADLSHEMETKTRIVKEKSPSPTDPELEGLRKEYEALKEEEKRVFPKSPMTDEARSALAERGLDREIAALEEQIRTGKVMPEAKGPERVQSASEKAKRARLEALRDQRQELRDSNEAVKQAKADKALEAQRVAAVKKVAELERQMEEGPDTKAGPQQGPHPDEIVNLAQARVRELQAQLREAQKTPWDVKRAEKLGADLRAAHKRLAEAKAKLARGDLSVKPRPMNRPLPPGLEEARQALDDVNKQIQKARSDAKRKTPEERALNSRKAAMTRRIADLEGRIARGDFTPKSKKTPVALDKTGQELAAREQRLKTEYEDARRADRLARRTPAEKWADWAVQWHRFAVISGLKSLGKIGLAGQSRIGMTVADALAGQVLNKVPGIREIAAGAPREGGLTGKTVENLAKGYVEGWLYAVDQAGKVLKTGRTDVEAAAKTQHYPVSLLQYMGNLHNELKLPAFAQEYKISLRERTAYEINQGTDMTNPVNQIRVNDEAIVDGLRAKFSHDNFITKRLNMVYNSLRNSKEHPTTGKVIEKVLRFLMPVVHIPTNYFVESATYANLGLGLPRASVKTLQAIRSGVDTLSPAQKDSIMRHWKKGSLGAGLLLLGFFNRNSIGGYYQPGQKKDPNKPEFGGVRLFGQNIPRWALHLPITEPLHVGATIGHVMDHITKKTGEHGSLTDGTLAAAAGLLDEIPYVSNARNVTELLIPDARGKYARGEAVKSAVVPRILSEIAEQTDPLIGPAKKRKENTITEHIESGIPGLRQTLPVKP